MWSSILTIKYRKKNFDKITFRVFPIKGEQCCSVQKFCFDFCFFCVFPLCFCCMWCTFFYQVPVTYGESLEQGKVPEICENAGMKALCFGDDSCSWTKNANSRQVSKESDLTLIMPIRCVVTPYNFGCGTTGSRNTLTKVQTRFNSSSIWGLSSKLKVSIFHSKSRHAYIRNDVFIQGTLWRHWSQELSWPLGSVQLYAKPRFRRVWDPKWNLVSEWQTPAGIPRKRQILCSLR